jgi:hypothetical protein
LECCCRVPIDAIKHHGGWEQSNLERSYDKKMSVDAVLALGHHEIRPVPQYVVKRSRVVREGFEDLAAEVFPGAFELYGRIIEV